VARLVFLVPLVREVRLVPFSPCRTEPGNGGTSPVHGVLTEFGAIHYDTRDSFHGRLFEATPDPANPAMGNVEAFEEILRVAKGS
jgi:hypothetical protein